MLVPKNNRGENNPFYGKHHTIETKEKWSQDRKGKYIGKDNPFFGKHHTEETKEKLRKVRKGKHLPDKWKERIAKGHIGLYPTENTILKRSKALKGHIVSLATREKISKSNKDHISWNKGRKGAYSDKAREKMSKAQEKRFRNKENHPNWQGGISFKPYPAEFDRQLKELIRQRDNYQCQKCGCPEVENIEKLSIHHIDYNKQNCLPSNLIALCRRCNCAVNFNREYWTEYFQSLFEEEN